MMVANRARRIALLTREDNKLVGIVTPVDLLLLARENLSDLGSLAALDVGTLFVKGAGSVVALNVHTSVNEALETLANHSFSSLPLLDTDGSIVAVFSMTDVLRLARLSHEDMDTALANSCGWFLSKT